jgi:hypothetical protein
LLFCSRFRSACGRARLFASISIPESRPAQIFPSVLHFLSTSSLGRSFGVGTQCTAQVPAFLRGRFSSRVVLDSPCSFCLHDFSCVDFCCRYLIFGFRASRARSGFGFLSSPLCFLVCVRSLPPESCSLPFSFLEPGLLFSCALRPQVSGPRGSSVPARSSACIGLLSAVRVGFSRSKPRQRWSSRFLLSAFSPLPETLLLQSALVLHGSNFISFVVLLDFWSISSQRPSLSLKSKGKLFKAVAFRFLSSGFAGVANQILVCHCEFVVAIL